MTEKEKLQLESKRLDREMIEVLTQISIVAGRLARNIQRYSDKQDTDKTIKAPSKNLEIEKLIYVLREKGKTGGDILKNGLRK